MGIPYHVECTPSRPIWEVNFHYLAVANNIGDASRIGGDACIVFPDVKLAQGIFTSPLPTTSGRQLKSQSDRLRKLLELLSLKCTQNKDVCTQICLYTRFDKILNFEMFEKDKNRIISENTYLMGTQNCQKQLIFVYFRGDFPLALAPC